MEELIRSKIAELEENYPQQALEQKILREITALDAEITFDESEMCRSFDSEVIDERKALDERIRNVRDLYIQEIRTAKQLETECHAIFQENKSCIANLVLLSNEQTRKKKELKAQEDLKTKLHEMCRLLQKQAKEIVEDSERQREMERNRMTELSQSFQDTITGITSKIAEQEELFEKQAAENSQLKAKLLEFQEHTKLRDTHFKSQLHAKDLEFQLIEARRAQEAQLLKQERVKAETYRNDITKLTNSKIELKNQLTLYSDKFDHFQDALTRSQKMFIQFEEKMNTMEQTVEKLESINNLLKNECYQLDIELLSQLDKKEEGTKQQQLLQKEKTKLADECRVLQTKRNLLMQKLSALSPQTSSQEEQNGSNPQVDGSEESK